MTEDILPVISTAKLFKKRVIVICAFLAGPLVGGYMIAENFKHIGEKASYIRTLIITIAFTVVITLAMLFVPAIENIPNIVFPLCFASIASACVYFLQENKLQDHINNGAVYHKNERAFLVSLISLAIYIAFAFCLVYLFDVLTVQ
jgi:MFS family permease